VGGWVDFISTYTSKVVEEIGEGELYVGITRERPSLAAVAIIILKRRRSLMSSIKRRGNTSTQSERGTAMEQSSIKMWRRQPEEGITGGKGRSPCSLKSSPLKRKEGKGWLPLCPVLPQRVGVRSRFGNRGDDWAWKKGVGHIDGKGYYFPEGRKKGSGLRSDQGRKKTRRCHQHVLRRRVGCMGESCLEEGEKKSWTPPEDARSLRERAGGCPDNAHKQQRVWTRRAAPGRGRAEQR